MLIPNLLRGPAELPLRVLFIVLVMIFVVEYGIMLVLARFSVPANGTGAALVDSLALSAALFPALWLVVVRPLRSLSESRGKLLARLFEVQEQERARLARDLHDELGQHLTAVLVTLRAAEDAGDLAQAKARIEIARESASSSLAAVRRLARDLRPSAVRDVGLGAAVQALCHEFTRTHAVPVELDMASAAADELSPPIETCIFRVVQEALTNIARHADAKRVCVRLTRSGPDVELSIRDDGRGFDPDMATGSLGLQGMRERVSLLGGELRVQSSPGRGASLTASLPAKAPT